MHPSPRLDSSSARRLAPYSATLLLAFALVALDSNVRVGEFAAAFGLACMVPVAVAFLPWASLPRSARLAPTALFFIALALLRDSVGGASAGVGIVALLPICWLALHGSRRELVLGLAAIAALWALPVLLIGGTEYPPSQLRAAVMYVAVASVIGLTVQGLVAALEAQATNVARVAAAARSVLSADDARSEICSAACHVSGGSFAFLFEPTGDGRLCSTAMAGLTVAPMAMHMDSELSGTGTAFVSRRSTFVKDAGGHPTIDRAMWEAHGRPASMLFEPVIRGEDTVGVLVVGWTRPVADVRMGGPALIGLLATEAASAIAHTDLVGRLGELAATDALTGLANRRTWNRELARALHRSPRRDGCVAMLDLDHFKRFNDQHGHLAGDRQLSACAVAWQAQLRPGDILARLGGEEFAVLLSGCTLAGATAVIERLRGATPGGQTCSAGLVARRDGEPADELMARADRALYAAKHAGRNQLLAA
ncbi:MAG TPA: sensor domain-containing diguanylate cyclase [Baekduia sp.]|nr:sensor domain-containing diguanylate cyclase [Baekduia sp.]